MQASTSSQPSHPQQSAETQVSSDKHSGFSPFDQKYLEHVDTIFKEQRISSLRAPTFFYLSGGFICPSLEDAAGIIRRFVSFERPIIEVDLFNSQVRDQIISCPGFLSAQIPEELLQGRTLAQYYQTFSIRPLGEALFSVQLGDGVIPATVHAFMNTPSLIAAEISKFSLEPIPKTRGASAFSTEAAAALIAERLGKGARVTEFQDDIAIEVAYTGETFITSFSLLTCNRSVRRPNSSLIVIPCFGMQPPPQLRDRLLVQTSPQITKQFETLDSVLRQNEKLAVASRIITSEISELFGVMSPTRVKSVMRS